MVGITGASGHLLAQLCVDKLLDYGYPILLVCTAPGRRVWHEEMDEDVSEAVERWQARGDITHYNVNDVGAPVASGGLVTQGMLVIPCSMGTVSDIATGAGGNLLERAADVTIKEFRPLVLVPRETPLSPIHLENLLKLARMGVRIVPPMPAYYLKPRTIHEALEQLVPRVLNALGIPEALDEPAAYQPTQ